MQGLAMTNAIASCHYLRDSCLWINRINVWNLSGFRKAATTNGDAAN